MSTKTWKNKELTTLLSEAWGFGFNLDSLKEGELKGGLKDYMDKKHGEDTDDDKDDEDDEETKTEAFEHPKSALGAGPTNKGGKIERSDVANKDTSKFGQGGSKGGGKESASGSTAAPKAGKIDRSDVANKASGRWLKENEEEGETLDEMCPGSGEEHDHDMGMEKVSYEGPEGRAAELVDELKELIMQMQGGGMVPGNRTYQEGEEAEELEERHKPPNVAQGRDSARRTKKASGERVEEQVRRLIRKSLKNLQEKKKK